MVIFKQIVGKQKGGEKGMNAPTEEGKLLHSTVSRLQRGNLIVNGSAKGEPFTFTLDMGPTQCALCTMIYSDMGSFTLQLNWKC